MVESPEEEGNEKKKDEGQEKEEEGTDERWKGRKRGR